ncbi:MAG: DUF5715 family protein [Gemmatimonadaceae bacterium]
MGVPGAAVAIGLLAASSAQAQRRAKSPEELRGSKASVEKMYEFAQSNRMPFYLTQTNVDAAIEQGRLVPLTGGATYELTRGVGFSYSTKEARQFVEAFAPQYLAACGTPLVVTSAARPLNRQPHNANAHSVHPTGIAVDIRRPPAGPCLTWVRSALTTLETKGIIEATEEHHPVHLHLAVLVAPGRSVLLPQLATSSVAAVHPPVPATTASTVSTSGGEVQMNGKRSYVVREGDTLWDIANRTGVTVKALKRANGNTIKRTLRPGTTLVLPVNGAL